MYGFKFSYPLKFHTKFWTHTPQNVRFTVFIFCVWVTISLNCDVISLSETGPSIPLYIKVRTNIFSLNKLREKPFAVKMHVLCSPSYFASRCPPRLQRLWWQTKRSTNWASVNSPVQLCYQNTHSWIFCTQFQNVCWHQMVAALVLASQRCFMMTH